MMKIFFETLAMPAGVRQMIAAVVLTVGMVVVVGTALAFEHIGGYIPCALCLEQRVPYYTGIPLMLFAQTSATNHLPAYTTRGLLLIGGLLMTYGIVMGTYHSGVEWGWWQGPESCTTVVNAVSGNAADLLNDLNAKRPPACDEAAGRFLGLSFAGWNVLASLGLAAIAFKGALGKAQ